MKCSRHPRLHVRNPQQGCLHRQLCLPPVFLQLWRKLNDIRASLFPALYRLIYLPNYPATQCYPAEVFPTRYKAFAHGISAAVGKAGAIIAALAFNSLSKKIGTPAVLWSASLALLLSTFLLHNTDTHLPSSSHNNDLI